MNTENPNPDALVNLLEIISTRKKQIIIAFLIVFGITVAGVILMPPVYTASTAVYIGLPAIPKGDLSYLSDIQSGPTYVLNQLAFARSRSVYEKAARELRLPEKMAMETTWMRKFKGMLFKSNVDPLEKSIDALYRNTAVDIKKGTNILEIVANSSSAEGAADTANALANSYTDFVNNLSQSKSNYAYGFITDRMDEIARNLSVSQSRLFEFMKANNVISLESLKLTRSNVQNELTSLKLKYQQLGGKNQSVENQWKGEQADDSLQSYQIQPADTPRVREIKAHLQNLKRELKAVLKTYTENHPSVIAIQDQISKDKEELTQEMGSLEKERGRGDSPQQDTQNRRSYLITQIKTLDQELARLSQVEIELTKMMRDVSSQENEQKQLQQQYASASILKTNTMQEGRIKIMDMAYPPAGANNKKKIIMLLVGFVAAIMFGLGSAFVAEYYDDSLNSTEQVESYLKIQVLGSIPPIDAKKQK